MVDLLFRKIGLIEKHSFGPGEFEVATQRSFGHLCGLGDRAMGKGGDLFFFFEGRGN